MRGSNEFFFSFSQRETMTLRLNLATRLFKLPARVLLKSMKSFLSNPYLKLSLSSLQSHYLYSSFKAMFLCRILLASLELYRGLAAETFLNSGTKNILPSKLPSSQIGTESSSRFFFVFSIDRICSYF